jgi:predicted MFS family arabinose efflux permease
LIFIVPIGDLVDRRHLILGQGLLSAIALVAVATAGTVTSLLIAMAVTDLLAVLVQVLVAYAAALATDDQRGTVVGIVTGGIVADILAARSVAGIVADFGGWRSVYMVSAVLTVLMIGILARVLPRRPSGRNSETYIHVLRSMPYLLPTSQSCSFEVSWHF